ncbi:CDP-alcohol phosphatidyltransferase family protein [Nesterenkonia sp. HG001]|uniref:CDP-alcohol phosphatidyltransferase family protein n=1 Tax=Nesterenkonia sp. HG001 TaxID=2983207 RepID=UPI002AC72717|nr:CDP-alcohol phosphatidyltransferase family protein [Nesterenkonia sp. HG001]MDZ5076179.1 hypothetical protein [Nesterenkonia sp. HG001]
MDLRRRPLLGSAAVIIAAALLLGALLHLDGALTSLLLSGPEGIEDSVDGLLAPGEGLGVPAVTAGMIAFASCQLHALRGAGRFRLADAVTLLRCMLLGVFTAAAIQATSPAELPTGSGLPLPLIFLAAIILLIDGLDGAVARSAGGETPAGGRYDETSDAVVLLVLALTAALAVGWWALLLGLLRPAFAVGGRIRPAWRQPLDPSRRRKICGIAPGILLLGALAPWPAISGVTTADVELGLRALPVALGLTLVTISFGLDVLRLERASQDQPPNPGTTLPE